MTSRPDIETLAVQRHGRGPMRLVCLHGGPGAGCSLACVARPLAERFAALDYLQRRSGNVPLTVARHVEDLRAIVERHGDDRPPVILGASWGAMLALAFGAAHPGLTGGLVLVGCGTFDKRSRAMIEPTRQSRIRPEHRAAIARLERQIADPAERLGAIHALTGYVDHYDPMPADDDGPDGRGFDAAGFQQTWDDMMRLQEAGVYPSAFSAIGAPVLMVHGSYDPHPGGPIRDSLLPHLPQLRYVELDRCGHEPWRERQARERFFATVADWLAGVLRD